MNLHISPERDFSRLDSSDFRSRIPDCTTFSLPPANSHSLPTCKTSLRIDLAMGRRRGVVGPAVFPRLCTVGADTRSWLVLGAHVEAALVVIVAVQRPRGLPAGLGDVRVWNHCVFQRPGDTGTRRSSSLNARVSSSGKTGCGGGNQRACGFSGTTRGSFANLRLRLSTVSRARGDSHAREIREQRSRLRKQLGRRRSLCMRTRFLLFPFS